jgi:hypothetical protein
LGASAAGFSSTAKSFNVIIADLPLCNGLKRLLTGGTLNHATTLKVTEPTAADPPVNTFLVRSIDWSALLVSGKTYKIRQNFYRHATKTREFDVAYTFTYNGFVTQNDAIKAGLPADQAFMLSDREVCYDATGIKWGTVRVFRQGFTLEDGIGSDACLLQEHACDQWHFSRVSTPLTGSH